MNNMEKFMALGLDYFDAELCVQAGSKSANDIAFDTMITCAIFFGNETRMKAIDSMFYGAHPIKILFLCVDSNPIGLN